jgi:hypothetical protein
MWRLWTWSMPCRTYPTHGRTFRMQPFALTSDSRSATKTNKEIGGTEGSLLPEITRDFRSVQGSMN